MPKTVHHSLTRFASYEHFKPAEIIDGIASRYPAISDFTFTYEGGYVNDPDDPGGCTNMGITQATLSAWRNMSVTCEQVKEMPKMEAQMIYAQNYWVPVWGNDTPVGVNCQMYDWGVNSGPATAIRYVQHIVGVSEDGIMGPNTLTAIQSYCKDVGTGPLIDLIRDERQAYYESLSTFSKYGNGWTSRNNDCTTLAHSLSRMEFPNIPHPPVPPLDIDARVTKLEQWASGFTR